MNNNTCPIYGDNQLINHLPPIPTHKELLKHLTNIPEIQQNILDLPAHLRRHALNSIDSLHIPSYEEVRLADSIDMMIRKGYSFRNPAKSVAWEYILGVQKSGSEDFSPKNIAANVAGLSGVGKTTSIKKILSYYPQLIVHDEFPNVLGKHFQITWLSVSVPASGTTSSLALALMEAYDKLVTDYFGSSSARFNKVSSNTKGDDLLETWRKVAMSHFLGLLHMDEIQNLFNIPTLQQRKNKSSQPLQLKIVEDKVLKWVMNFNDCRNVPSLFSGTPDGMEALGNRFATAQRISTYGQHEMDRFMSIEDPEYFRTFLPHLMRYQFVKYPIELTPQFASSLLKLTAGIKRIIITIWVAAQKHALSRGDEKLTINDFEYAYRNDLKKVIPAIEALHSGNPILMSRYEDLLLAF